MPAKRRFWLAVAVQVLVLLTMISVHGYTLATGRPVTLKTVPVDPWSYTTGRYVALSYEISQVTEGQIPMAGAPYRPRQTVWVTLKPGDPYWTATAISASRPAVAAGQVAARATVNAAWQPYDERSWNNGSSIESKEARGPWQYRLGYGIEQFYIPEAERELERRGGEFTVEAVVDSFGRMALHRVFLDGKELKWQ